MVHKRGRWTVFLVLTLFLTLYSLPATAHSQTTPFNFNWSIQEPQTINLPQTTAPQLILDKPAEFTNATIHFCQTCGGYPLNIKLETGNIPRNHNVNIKDFTYEPTDLTIKQGDKVIWTNNGATQHTITATSPQGAFNKVLNPGERFEHTFTTTGTFRYQCDIHPSMTGKIIVQPISSLPQQQQDFGFDVFSGCCSGDFTFARCCPYSKFITFGIRANALSINPFCVPTCSGGWSALIAFSTILTEKTDTVTGTEQAKPLGLIKDFIPSTAQPASVKVTNTNPQVMMWVGGPEDFTLQTTTTLDDTLFACVDIDENKQCDFFEAQPCTTRGGDYYRGVCCGTDIQCNQFQDFGGTQALCGKTNTGQFQWITPDEPGEIHILSCPAGQRIHTGTTLTTCTQDNEFSLTTRGEQHDYICKNNELFECGGQNPFSSINRIQTGQKLFGQYCASDGDFTTELDNKDSTTCNLAGFTHTGSKCCGEPEDNPEFYNDPALTQTQTPGGCYASKYIELGRHARNIPDTTQEDKRIINLNGSFTTCTQTTIPADLSTLKDTHTNQQLLNTKQHCGPDLSFARPTGIEPHARCQPFGNFTFHQQAETTLPKPTPQPNNEGCCSTTTCWNGTACQQTGTFFDAGDTGFLCEQGLWKQTRKKYNPDRTMSGFCPEESQCLIHTLGNPTLNNQPDKFLLGNPDNPNTIPQCLNNSQHTLDFFCNNGIWTSRTKLLATQLFALANGQSEFTISCDNHKNTLNTITYNPGRGLIQQFITTPCIIGNKLLPCVNNFCILTLPQGTAAIATSSNIDITNPQSILRAFNTSETSCNNANTPNNGFQPCNPQPPLPGRLWYNRDINSIIYLPQTLQTTLTDTTLQTKLNPIIAYAFRFHNPNNPRLNLSFFNTTTLLHTTYYTQKNNQHIFAFLENNQTPQRLTYLGVRYTNINLGTDPCFTFFKRADPLIICDNQQQGEFIAITKTTTLANAFPDLGSKLRLT